MAAPLDRRPPQATASYGYCDRCGQALVERLVREQARPHCPACNRTIYRDPKLAVAVIIASDGKIILQRRAIEPGRGAWTFPSGYVDRGEVVEAAAMREVQEEICLPVRIDWLVGLYSTADNPVVLAVYAATPLAETFAVGDEVEAVALFEPDALPPLAFPHDRQIVADYLAQARLRRASDGG